MAESLKASHINGTWRPEFNRTQAKRIDAAAKLIESAAELTKGDADGTLACNLRAFLCRYAADQVDADGELLPAKPRDAEAKSGEGEESPAGPEQESNEELAA